MTPFDPSPGPWTATVLDDKWQVLDSGGFPLASVYGRFALGTNRGAANAALMATAPELLTALESILEMLDEWDSGFTVPGEEFSEVEAARAVIAKLKGTA